MAQPSDHHGLSPSATTTDPSPQTVLLINSLIAEFCLRNDRPEYGAVADLFVDDAVLTLGALVLEGRDAIAAFFDERNARHAATGRVTRHVCGPIAVRERSPGVVEAHAGLLVFAGVGERPLKSEPPSTVGDFDCVCVRDDSGRWRFSSRAATAIFSGPAASWYVK